MAEMFQMGKYGAYVWSSYGLAVMIMAYIAIKPLIDKKTIVKDLMMKYRREAGQNQKQDQKQKQKQEQEQS